MSNLRSAVVFITVALLWGVPFAFIALALDAGASPMFIAWSRVSLGAIVLMGIAWSRVSLGAIVLMGIACRRGFFTKIRRHAGIIAVIAACDIAVPFALLPIAQQRLSSSLAGILIATTPLFVATLAIITRTERHNLRGSLGLLLGLAGVGAIFGLQLSGDLITGLLALGAALSYAVATLLVRRLHDVSALELSAASLVIASVLLTPAAFIDLQLPTQASGWVALVVLGALCTAAAVALFYRLVADLGATRAALSLYVAPVFAVIVGAAFLAESIGLATIIGFLLILAGSWLSHRNITNRTPGRTDANTRHKS
ncbi:DMT family transporter [Brevibacterium sandarakinum]|nr:DMT family transporter [Brevibacterium sandarakinum]